MLVPLFLILFSSGMMKALPQRGVDKESIQQVLASLQHDPSGNVQPRPQIITKQTFKDEESKVVVPKPFTITTDLHINQPQKSQEVGRSGRQITIPRTSRKAKVNFPGLSKLIQEAPIIQGMRVPDDETDRVVHRNGRFINNIFIPGDTQVDLPEFTVASQMAQENGANDEVERRGRSTWTEDANIDIYTNNNRVDANELKDPRALPFDFNFNDFYAGRKQDLYDAVALESQTNEVYTVPDADQPQYYLQDEPTILHDDRSPYTFEPADTQTRFVPPSHLQSAVIPASNQEFEIKQHTYQMCPGCPVFSIPIPVPKAAALPGGVDPQSQVINPYHQDPGFEYHDRNASPADKEMSLVDRITNTIVDTIQPVIKRAQSWLEPLNPLSSNGVSPQGIQKGFSERQSLLPEQTDRQSLLPGQSGSPLMFATVAAVGLGVATILSTGIQLIGFQAGKRSFPSFEFAEKESSPSNNVNLAYDPNNVMCLPRNFCEKMKTGKSLLDGYPNTKKIAYWMLEKVYDTDKVYERDEVPPFYDQCNLRECLFSLVS